MSGWMKRVSVEERRRAGVRACQRSGVNYGVGKVQGKGLGLRIRIGVIVAKDGRRAQAQATKPYELWKKWNNHIKSFPVMQMFLVDLGGTRISMS